MIPYSRQCIDEKDIEAVVSVLRSGWLTTGPKVAEFEKAINDFVGAKHAVAVSSGTAALHCAMYAIDIGPGDEVIVPAMIFVGQKMQAVASELEHVDHELEGVVEDDKDNKEAFFVFIRVKRAKQLGERAQKVLKNPIIYFFVK